MIVSFEILTLVFIYFNKKNIEYYNRFSLIYEIFLLISIYEYSFNNDEEKSSIIILGLYLRYFIETSISLSYFYIVIVTIIFFLINIPIIIQYDIIIEALILIVICMTISIIFLNKTRKLIIFIS